MPVTLKEFARSDITTDNYYQLSQLDVAFFAFLRSLSLFFRFYSLQLFFWIRSFPAAAGSCFDGEGSDEPIECYSLLPLTEQTDILI